MLNLRRPLDPISLSSMRMEERAGERRFSFRIPLFLTLSPLPPWRDAGRGKRAVATGQCFFHSTLDFGHWTLGFGLWALGFEAQTLNPEPARSLTRGSMSGTRGLRFA
jgi:hypothetical protein